MGAPGRGAASEGRGTVLARAVTDGDDRLLSAEEPLAGLQSRAGGEVPGVVMVPELLEIVRQVRQRRLPLGRAIWAQDGAEMITAWVEVEPRTDAEGCSVVLRSWRAVATAAEDAHAALERRNRLDRQVAELTARLDADQRILTVESECAELDLLTSAMATGRGRIVTEFIAAGGHDPARPLHWRLLDDARIKVEGSPREWRVVVIPQGRPGYEPSSFELLLVSDEPPGGLPHPEHGAGGAEGLGSQHLVGQDLAPVLRRPIARIVANAETIRTRLAGPLPDAYADYAAEIANAGRLLLGLLEDLADMEVVESEGFSTAPDNIDLAEVARQAAGILNVRAREKGIEIDAPSAAESLPAVAEFRRVLQVLINLIGNAIRYSPENSRIWIRLDSAGDCARVTVADQGPGLSDSDQGLIFEKFERLGRSGDGGSGLGLYISRRLARAMGGELSVESAKGQGARFVLEVPAGSHD